MEAESHFNAPKKSRKTILKLLLVFLITVLAGILVYIYWLNQYAESQVCSELKLQLERCQVRAQDWAKLGRYREDNARIIQMPGNEKRVVFMGDSITEGWNLSEYFPHKSYINRGISAQTTPQMLIRFRADAIALNPKVVVILAGTNDIAGITGATSLKEIENNLASMAELARVHNMRVVLASVLPVRENPEEKSYRPADQIKALNMWIKEYAAQNKFTYLDYYSVMSDENGLLKRELSDDGLHPNAKGYSAMAPLAEQAINSALETKAK